MKVALVAWEAQPKPPDVAFTIGDPFQFFKDELIRTFRRKTIERYMPSYVKLMQANPFGFKMFNPPGKKDEYLAIMDFNE